MQDKKQIILISVVAVIVIIGIGLLAYFSKGKTGHYEGLMTLEKMSVISSCPLTEDKDSFAKCLTEKGWTMYGAEWCPHCKDQKELFGSSFQYIKYVECPDNTELCTIKGINGYPTWLVE